MSETEPTTSTTESSVPVEKPDEHGEPETKRQKITSKSDNKLEDRLGGILCCSVCLDLPRAAVYQCSNGHLMCAGCFTQILADARLRDETATCSSCRVEISKTSATRNLAVENTVSELPSECRFCNKEFPRNSLERHENEECEERFILHNTRVAKKVVRCEESCKYHCIGCPWRGPVHEKTTHELECSHSNKSIPEVMEALQQLDQQLVNKMKLFDTIFELLVYEKITFNDIQLKPYRTDEFVHKLFYESSRFSAFNHQWVVKARINDSQKDPSQSSEREMAYQLVIKSRILSSLNLKYIVLRSPFDDVKVNPQIHQFEFNAQEDETPYVSLPLPDTVQCNRLLAAKTINLRLIMFLTSKPVA